MKYRRIPYDVDAELWEGPDAHGNVPTGVLCGQRGNRPRYYVKTPDGPVDLVIGEAVYVYPSRRKDGYFELELAEAFLARFQVAPGEAP